MVEYEEQRRVTYPFTLLEELELSYAVTIHKSQGSEYPRIPSVFTGIIDHSPDSDTAAQDRDAAFGPGDCRIKEIPVKKHFRSRKQVCAAEKSFRRKRNIVLSAGRQSSPL